MENKFTLLHVGINTGSPEEALSLSAELCRAFNLTPREGKASEFAGSFFECMRTPFLGAHGHIAMGTPDPEAAVQELAAKGFEIRPETASYDSEGRLKCVYLADEFCGFAVHLLRL